MLVNNLHLKFVKLSCVDVPLNTKQTKQTIVKLCVYFRNCAFILFCVCLEVRPQQPKQGKMKVKATRSTGEMPTESEAKDNDRNKHLVTGPVVIYDIFCILPISRQLAQDYV